MSQIENEMIEKNRLMERERRAISDIIELIAQNAYDYVIRDLTIDRVQGNYIEDGCKSPFIFPGNKTLTLEIKLTLGKKKKVTKKKSVKKTGKL